MSTASHVYPTNDEHLTEGADCWCCPHYEKPCPVCCGEDAEPDSEFSCKNCGGTGWIDATHDEAIDPDGPDVIVIHNRFV